MSIGTKDTVSLAATLWDFSSIDWAIRVENSSGTKVAESTGTGPDVAWDWNGTGTSGGIVPDGTYTLRLVATDQPGNINNGASVQVVVDTAAPVLSNFASDVARFGPNSTPDRATFTAGVNEQVAWVLTVTKGGWSTAFNGSAPGNSQISQVWTGTPNNGDGTYIARMDGTDLAGNLTTTTTTVVRDSTGPVVSGFEASNLEFSPGTTSSKTSTSITATLVDAWSPINWTLEIRNSSSTLVRSVSEPGNPNFLWNGTDSSGNIVPDGAYTVKLLSFDGGLNQTLPIPTLSIKVDTLIPFLNPLSLTPADHGNTVYISQQRLLGKVLDSFSGISLSDITFQLKDENTAVTTNYPATNYSSSSGWARTNAVVLQIGHVYTVKMTALDKAGNEAVMNHSAASVGGGFLVIDVDPQTSQASVPISQCTVGSVDLATASREVRCEEGELQVQDTSVVISASRHTGFTSFVRHDVDLTGAVFTTTIAGVPFEQAVDSLPDTTSMQLSVKSAPALSQADVENFDPIIDVSGAERALGTVVGRVPATWSDVKLTMSSVTTTASMYSCSDSGITTTTPRCSPDPLHSRFLVTTTASVTNIANEAARQASTYGLIIEDIYSDGFRAAIPQPALSGVKADANNASVSRYTLRVGGVDAGAAKFAASDFIENEQLDGTGMADLASAEPATPVFAAAPFRGEPAWQVPLVDGSTVGYIVSGGIFADDPMIKFAHGDLEDSAEEARQEVADLTGGSVSIVEPIHLDGFTEGVRLALADESVVEVPFVLDEPLTEGTLGSYGMTDDYEGLKGDDARTNEETWTQLLFTSKQNSPVPCPDVISKKMYGPDEAMKIPPPPDCDVVPPPPPPPPAPKTEYIPNHQDVPILHWWKGCTPTAASMVEGWWSKNGHSALMTTAEWATTYENPVIAELADHMNTDADDGTTSWDMMSTGIQSFEQDRANLTRTVSRINNPTRSNLVNQIDNNELPVMFGAVDWLMKCHADAPCPGYPQGAEGKTIGHSVAVYGYHVDSDSRTFIIMHSGAAQDGEAWTRWAPSRWSYSQFNWPRP